MTELVGTTLEDLATPCLVVDEERLDRNIAAMAGAVQRAGLALRPHAKTHKCLEIGRRQIDAGAVGLTLATVSEAEVFAAAGFDDVFLAYPVWADARRGARIRELARAIRLRVGVDSAEGAEALAAHTRGVSLDVLVEVDSGHHRTGVNPERAGEVAAAAARAGLRVHGVFTFPGHSYGPGRARPVIGEEGEALVTAAESLRAEGVPCEVLSGGSTPTAALTDGTVLTEVRPGVYVFGDAQQAELGTCALDDVALTALGTVVSRHGRSVVLDAGSKVLGADRPAWATGFGRLPDHPAARIPALSEHHATVDWPVDEPLPRLGEKLRVAPNHVCAAVNLADELVVARDGSVVDRWRVAARGRNV